MCWVIEDIRRDPDLTVARAWETVGPKRLTRTVAETNCRNITVYPSHYFMPAHASGARYSGSGRVFAHQMWASTKADLYENLAGRSVEELAEF